MLYVQYHYRPGTITGWLAHKLDDYSQRRRSEQRCLAAAKSGCGCTCMPGCRRARARAVPRSWRSLSAVCCSRAAVQVKALHAQNTMAALH
jgi:hypothetical protein